MTFSILYIEDQTSDFKKVQDIAIYYGWDIEDSSSISDFHSKVNKNKYDLYLVDLNLSDSIGIDTFKTVYEYVEGKPIVVVSSLHEDKIGKICVSLGAQDYLSKDDLTANNLKRAVNWACERSAYVNKIQEQAKELRLASELKSVFLANMSHEIRTPISGIVGILNLFKHENSEQKEYLSTMRMSVNHLMSIINNILDLSKIEAGMLEIDEQEFQLRKIVDEVNELFSANAALKNNLLFSETLSDVPRTLKGDPTAIKQILSNLVNNALKFSSSAYIKISTRVLKRSLGVLTLRFEVSDTGPGIPLDKQSLIFESFTQENSSTRRVFGGTGLGLTISKQLVKAMGGKIGVKSKLGEGSIFWFELPFEEIHEVYDSRLSVARAKLQLRCSCPAIRSYLSKILDERGFKYSVVKKVCSDEGIVISEKNLSGSASDLSVTISPFNDAAFSQSAILEKIMTGILDERKVLSLKKSAKEDKFSEKLSVLIAEDDLVNRKVAEKLLKKLGLDVTVAINGKEAVSFFQAKHFDVILMDCHMPEMDGFEATEKIRSLQGDRTPYIIALTANALKGANSECIAAGMDNYMSKPLKIEELSKTLKNYCENN